MSTTDIKEAAKKKLLDELEKMGKGVNKEEQVKQEREEEFLLEEEKLDTSTGTWYSQIFQGGKAFLKEKKLPDIEISSIFFAKDEWDEEDREFIPEIDSDYVWQHPVLYPAVLALVKNLKVMVHGPTGSGKTTMYQNIAANCNWPYYRLSGRQDIESDEIFGHQTIKDGNMEFELAEFPKAYKKGYLIAVDEPWKMPSGIQMTFQRVYERNGILQLESMQGSLKDKQIYPAPTTRMILADNVVGTGDGADKYSATMIQDSSTLNRMDLVLYLDYLSPAKERQMLLNKYKTFLPDNKAKQVVQLANLIRKGFEQGELSVTMSPRNTMAWLELSEKIRDYKQAFKWTMLYRFAEDSEKSAVASHYKTVFGESLT